MDRTALLEAENAALRARVAAQDGLIAELRAQVAELAARVGQDSKNSSRPPSSEGLAKKPATAWRPQGQAAGLCGCAPGAGR